MVKKYQQLIKIEGDHLMASFLLDRRTIDNVVDFIKEIIIVLKKRRIKFIGIYRSYKKVKTFKIKNISYKNLFNTELYFTGNINKVEVLFSLHFYKYLGGYLCMDFVTSHFDVAEKNSPSVNEKNVLKFYRIARDIYLLAKPLYGLIGQEDFVPSPDWVVKGTAKLPHFWAFYSKRIVDLIGLDKLFATLKGSHIVEKLPDGGVFFALSKWTEVKPNKKFERIQRRLLSLTDKISEQLAD